MADIGLLGFFSFALHLSMAAYVRFWSFWVAHRSASLAQFSERVLTHLVLWLWLGLGLRLGFASAEVEVGVSPGGELTLVFSCLHEKYP